MSHDQKCIELHRRADVDGVVEETAERVLVFPAQVAAVSELPDGGARVWLANSNHYIEVAESYDAVCAALVEAGLSIQAKQLRAMFAVVPNP